MLGLKLIHVSKMGPRVLLNEYFFVYHTFLNTFNILCNPAMTSVNCYGIKRIAHFWGMSAWRHNTL